MRTREECGGWGGAAGGLSVLVTSNAAGHLLGRRAKGRHRRDIGSAAEALLLGFGLGTLRFLLLAELR